MPNGKTYAQIDTREAGAVRMANPPLSAIPNAQPRLMGNQPQIAFVTHDDPLDKRSWSGINYYMAASLQKHCGDVHRLGPVQSRLDVVGRAYDYTHSEFLARRYAQILERRVAAGFDLIFALSASTDVAFINTEIPIVYLSGTTFRLMHNYYGHYSNLVGASVREGNKIEGLAIRKARLLLYPSEWAAASAVHDYGADEGKVHVVPFGANLDHAPREVILKRKRADQCRLLFVGVDWQRKGGDIALETLVKLRELGVPAHLTVCGCRPPEGISCEQMTVIPFLDKNDEAQRTKLTELFLASDFLLLPTRSECFGVVFCEASAFGLPVIATATGGVGGAVRDGENGFLLPASARGLAYAGLIRRLYEDEQRYAELVRASRATFETRLNWDAWGVGVGRLIAEMLGNKMPRNSAPSNLA